MAVMTDQEFSDALARRIGNPAIENTEFDFYIELAKKDVIQENYSLDNGYEQQILDTACLLLQIDNKFPEITGVSVNGVSTSFSQSDINRFRRRVASRRVAEFINESI